MSLVRGLLFEGSWGAVSCFSPNKKFYADQATAQGHQQIGGVQPLAAAAAAPPSWQGGVQAGGAAVPQAAAHPVPQQQWAWGNGKESAHSVAPMTARAAVSFSVRPKRPPTGQRERSNLMGEDEPEAFIAAQPRSTRGQVKPAAPTAVWSASLKEYVNRAFATCSSDLLRNRMEDLLKDKITAITTAGRMDGMDWTHEPLPGAHLQDQGYSQALRRGSASLPLPADVMASTQWKPGGALAKGTKRKSQQRLGSASDDDPAIARRQAKYKKSRYIADTADAGRAAIVFQSLGPVRPCCQSPL